MHTWDPQGIWEMGVAMTMTNMSDDAVSRFRVKMAVETDSTLPSHVHSAR